VKILLVDAQTLAREALVRVMAEDAPDAGVLQAETLERALAQMVEHPDIELVILDIELADATELGALETLRSSHADVPVIVLSARDDPGTARAVMDGGARGFVSKRSPLRVLAAAVRLVLAGGSIVPSGARRVPKSRSDGPDPCEPSALRAATSASSPRMIGLTPSCSAMSIQSHSRGAFELA